MSNVVVPDHLGLEINSLVQRVMQEVQQNMRLWPPDEPGAGQPRLMTVATLVTARLLAAAATSSRPPHDFLRRLENDGFFMREMFKNAHEVLDEIIAAHRVQTGGVS